MAFYRENLRFPETMAGEWFVEFKLNDSACLSIADADRTSQEACSGKGVTLTFEVRDIQAAHALLKKSGVSPTAITDHPWNARVFYMRDPEGNRIEVWSPKG